ncbi:MAG: c-type cytochrome [Serpentinimonas sp.]|nr:MAG: cytochrome C [Comamonadaceae bacterium BICA1-1]MDO9610540.1 c-type cytochrome [Serpentinimonas sp.]
MKSIATLIGVLALASSSLVAHAQSTRTDTLPNKARGEQIYMQMCMACHGVQGNSTMPENPSLAGQLPEYLIKQLRDYKSGKRQNAIMTGFAAALTDQDKIDVSHWLAVQTRAPNYARDPELVRAGERIWRGGLADRNIASCMACHGPGGRGMPALYPRLAGQHARYVVEQMKRFRTGARGNSPEMHRIARHMTDREIEAVADFIAGLR